MYKLILKLKNRQPEEVNETMIEDQYLQTDVSQKDISEKRECALIAAREIISSFDTGDAQIRVVDEQGEIVHWLVHPEIDIADPTGRWVHELIGFWGIPDYMLNNALTHLREQRGRHSQNQTTPLPLYE